MKKKKDDSWWEGEKTSSPVGKHKKIKAQRAHKKDRERGSEKKKTP